MTRHPDQIVVLDGYCLNPGDQSWDPIAALGSLKVYDRTLPEQILARAAGAQVLLTNKTPIDRRTIEALPELRFIAVLATGYNVVDIAAAAERGIPVSNVPEYGSSTVAQFTFALLLELCHHVGLHDQSVKRGEWARNPDWCYWTTPQIELAGRTMGVVGFGRIGQNVGRIARAMGMELLAHDTFPRQPDDLPVRFVSLEELFAQADVVSLHCPQTPQNEGFVNRALLERMKPTAFLLNAARGGLINQGDLADALNAARIAGAAVDVVPVEPIEPANPLLTARNCILTPHMAWASLGARQRIMRTTADNIAAFLRGQPTNVVNLKAAQA